MILVAPTRYANYTTGRPCERLLLDGGSLTRRSTRPVRTSTGEGNGQAREVMGTLPPPLSGYTNSELLSAKARLTVPFLGKLVVVVLGLVGRQLHPSRQQVSHELARRLNYVSGKSLVIHNF